MTSFRQLVNRSLIGGILPPRKWPRALLAYLKQRPFATTLTAIMIAGGLVLALPQVTQDATEFLFSMSPDAVFGSGHWWTVVTSLFIEPHPLALLLTVPVALFGVGWAEVIMGTRRTMLAFMITGAAGIGVTLLISAVALDFGAVWSQDVRHVLTSNTIAPAMGTLVAAAPWMSFLWRRRARLFALMFAVLAVAYSGQAVDFVQLFATLAGLAIGEIIGPQPRRFGWTRSSHHETLVMLGALQLVMALGPILTITSSRRLGALSPLGLLLTGQLSDKDNVNACIVGNITDNCVHELLLARISGPGPVILSLMPMATLVVLSYGLFRGKRFAAFGAIAINFGTSLLAAYYFGFLPLSGRPYVLAVHYSQHWEVTVSLFVSMALPLVMAITLANNIRHFPVTTSRGRTRKFLAATGLSLVSLSAIYVGIGWWARDQFTPTLTSITQLVVDAPEHFIPVGFLRLEQTEFLPNSPLTWLLFNWIGPVFWLIVLAGTVWCLTDVIPTRAQPAIDAVDRLLLLGGSSISHMATWRDNNYWFTSDGRACVAYRVSHGVALTIGGPFGDQDIAYAAAQGFATYCDDQGWTPAFYTVREQPVQHLLEHGWNSLQVGDETIINPHDWQPKGKKAGDVRTALSRAAREDVTAIWSTFRDLPASMQLKITSLSETWVAEKALPEMGFTLGGVDELRDPRVGLLLAVDATGSLQGVTSWLPCNRNGTVVGWTLDFMRRSPNAMNGTMEFLIATMVERQRCEASVEFVCLSVAPLAGVGAADDATTLERFLNFVGEALEPAYGFQSLYSFKRKFLPTLVPVYLVYPDPARLPAIGLAVINAYVPELSMRQTAQLVSNLSVPQE